MAFDINLNSGTTGFDVELNPTSSTNLSISSISSDEVFGSATVTRGSVNVAPHP